MGPGTTQGHLTVETRGRPQFLGLRWGACQGTGAVGACVPSVCVCVYVCVCVCVCICTFPALGSGGALKTCSTLHTHEPHSIRLLQQKATGERKKRPRCPTEPRFTLLLLGLRLMPQVRQRQLLLQAAQGTAPGRKVLLILRHFIACVDPPQRPDSNHSAHVCL